MIDSTALVWVGVAGHPTLMEAAAMSRNEKMPDSLNRAKAGKAQASLTLREVMPQLRIAGFSVNG